MSTNGNTVHVSLPKPLHEKAKAIATKERRTLASLVILALEAFLAKPAK